MYEWVEREKGSTEIMPKFNSILGENNNNEIWYNFHDHHVVSLLIWYGSNAKRTSHEWIILLNFLFIMCMCACVSVSVCVFREANIIEITGW